MPLRHASAVTLAALACFTLAAARTAHAGSVPVSFSGGNGSPLQITLPSPATFTVTTDTAATGAIFVFQGVGNILGGSAAGSGLSYTTNGGGTLSINAMGTFAIGDITANDLSLFRVGSPGVNLNDVLVLSAGTFTTNANFNAIPSSGSFSAILTDMNGTQLGVGNVVPEPVTLTALALAFPILLRRRA